MRNCEICNNKLDDFVLNDNNILSKCSYCGHIMRDLERCNANAREHAWGGVSIFDKVRNFLTIKSIKKNIITKSTKNIFEIGFGYGHILKKFLNDGYNVSGVERGLLEIEVDKDVKEKGELYWSNAEDFKFPEEQYDVVIGIHLIEHLDDVLPVFQNAYNSLKTGGKVYFITPNGDSLGLKIFKDKWWNLEDATHLRFFTKKSITHALELSGFKNIKVKKPIWDSVTLEINSILRYFNKSKKHGILSGLFVKVIDIILLPIFLLLRILLPNLSPSIEIIAEKK